MRVDSERQMLSPPKVAARYGVSVDKILGWIRRGELRAINIATRSGGRPRFAIALEDLLVFERRREVKIICKFSKRRRVKTDVTEFF